MAPDPPLVHAAPWAYTGAAHSVFGWHDDTLLIWTDLLPLTAFIFLGAVALTPLDGFYQVSAAFSNATQKLLKRHPNAPI
jgi:hypothetical protein